MMMTILFTYWVCIVTRQRTCAQPFSYFGGYRILDLEIYLGFVHVSVELYCWSTIITTPILDTANHSRSSIRLLDNAAIGQYLCMFNSQMYIAKGPKGGDATSWWNPKRTQSNYTILSRNHLWGRAFIDRGIERNLILLGKFIVLSLLYWRFFSVLKYMTSNRQRYDSKTCLATSKLTVLL